MSSDTLTELIRDELGNTGYRGHFTGAWVCYTCGPLCDPTLHGEADED